MLQLLRSLSQTEGICIPILLILVHGQQNRSGIFVPEKPAYVMSEVRIFLTHIQLVSSLTCNKGDFFEV